MYASKAGLTSLFSSEMSFIIRLWNVKQSLKLQNFIFICRVTLEHVHLIQIYESEGVFAVIYSLNYLNI